MGFFSKVKQLIHNSKADKVRMQMVIEQGNGFYAWDGKLYKSDIVRACIRPYAKAAGKMVPKHIRRDASGIKVNLLIGGAKSLYGMADIRYENGYQTEAKRQCLCLDYPG